MFGYNKYPPRLPRLTEVEEKAWKLYCKETAGGMHVADFWSDLPPSVQLFYLDKANA